MKELNNLMTNNLEYFYLGHFLPEDSEELISIVRSSDRIKYEYWNELFNQWQELKPNSFGKRQIHIHDTMLKENWAKVFFPNAFT
jgi:hypothetical protein